MFKSPVSVEVEEKYEYLSDVVWSTLQICHPNYEIVKIFAPSLVIVSSLFMEESPTRAALLLYLYEQKLKQLVE